MVNQNGFEYVTTNTHTISSHLLYIELYNLIDGDNATS